MDSVASILGILFEAASIDQATPQILRAMCESFAWARGALWTVDGDSLRCAQTWSAAPARDGDTGNGHVLTRGDGLPGRVWRDAAPEWVVDGAQSAIAFPVTVSGEVYGVMEFVSPETRDRDERILQAMAAAGDQVGRYIKRHREQNELSLLFELSLDMLVVAGFDGYFKRVNPAWEQILGYTEAELLSRPYVDFIHPDDIEPTRAVAGKLFEGYKVVHFENRYRHKDGSIRWLLWAAAPPQPGEQVVYGAARDVTELRAADALRAQAANLELLDALLNGLVDGGDLPEVFERVSAIARKVLPHDGLGLVVKNADGQTGRRYASSGLNLDVVETTDAIPIPDTWLQPDWEHDLVDDVSVHAAVHNKLAASMGFRGVLRLPIRFEGRFVALLAFLSKKAGTFAQTDILIARRIADRLAITLARDRELAASKRAEEATERASKLEARVRILTDELDARTGYRRVVGESLQWRQVLTQATQVAATETTVLLLGDSGTGKEVVARFVHRGSSRNNGPFVALNCAALPEQLLEAELFGYERGAYTGATQSKPGQLEQAAGGTLFLDEVAEMSPSAQAKFLRVLQEREFQRLGGTRVLRTDARIVAATNRDLQRAIANGHFREDLYYRLNVFAIKLPPLRDRRDDILPLSEAFLAEIGRGLGRPPAGIAREARHLLTDYHWPGNVRELRNILERAAILCDGGLITTEHLAIKLTAPAPAVPPPSPIAVEPREPVAAPAPASAAPAAAVPAVPGGDLQTMERAMIEQALQNARFNKSKAAKALGLTRHQLYIRMRKYGFE